MSPNTENGAKDVAKVTYVRFRRSYNEASVSQQNVERGLSCPPVMSSGFIPFESSISTTSWIAAHRTQFNICPSENSSLFCLQVVRCNRAMTPQRRKLSCSCRKSSSQIVINLVPRAFSFVLEGVKTKLSCCWRSAG